MEAEKPKMKLDESIFYGKELLQLYRDQEEIIDNAKQALQLTIDLMAIDTQTEGQCHTLKQDLYGITKTVEKIISAYSENPFYLRVYETLYKHRKNDKIAEEVFNAILKYIPDLSERIAQYNAK